MNYVEPIRNLEDIEKMKNVLFRISYRNYFLFYMGINVGLRISDILKLKVSDVRNRSHIVLTEQKTRKAKRILLNYGLREEISRYTEGMKDYDFLFPSRIKGQSIGRVQAYKIINKAAKEVGLREVGTHTLRKTFGYHHYQRNKDIEILRQIFNHSSPSITRRYIGIAQDEIDKSLEHFNL